MHCLPAEKLRGRKCHSAALHKIAERDGGLGNCRFLGCFRKIPLGAKGGREETEAGAAQSWPEKRGPGRILFLKSALISELCARGRDNVAVVEGSEKQGGFGITHFFNRCLLSTCYLLRPF